MAASLDGDSVSLVRLAALIYLPRIFVMDGALLPEAQRTRRPHGLQAAIGVNVEGVFIPMLCLLAFGFLASMIASLFAFRGKLPGAHTRLGSFPSPRYGRIVLCGPPPGARESRKSDPRQPCAGRALAAARFPLISCCGNIVLMPEGNRLLFPSSEDPQGRALLHEPDGDASAAFRTIRDYGGG